MAKRYLAFLPACALMVGAMSYKVVQMGRQLDGSYVVSSGQRVEGDGFTFQGRPTDIAMHPSHKFIAVLAERKKSGDKTKVFLVDQNGYIKDSVATVGTQPGYHGLKWTPDGKTLIAATKGPDLLFFSYSNGKLKVEDTFTLPGANPVPGGMAITKDGNFLFVACVNLNAIVEVNLLSRQRVRTFPVEQMPYSIRLSKDESKLIVTNWGGRYPTHGERTSLSEDNPIVVDDRGIPKSGTVSIVDRKTRIATSFEVGLHPCGIVIAENRAYVANAMSDSISEIDIDAARVTRTIPISWGRSKLLGSMPTALAIQEDKLYVCDGGDNAICQIDLPSGKVEGFRHAGYFPIAISLMGSKAFVVNSKGNGSVANTSQGLKGNAHDFQGTVSLIDLTKNLEHETRLVARDNNWQIGPNGYTPSLAVYKGAIKHVLYIIKENRTYDEVFGDMPEGNGDPKLCSIGEAIMPNHHAIVRQFTLFDNGYVSGTNSADGHAWSTQALATDYLERFYPGYARTYPDAGSDSMALSTAGCIWDAALRKHRTFRDYGEFADYDIAEYRPYKPKSWFEAWEDRKNNTHKFRYVAHTQVAALRPYLNHNYHYWPLIQSDQARADEFIREYTEFSKQDKVPNLTIMSLPSDHTEGMNPDYPLPKSMMADNDLALGRVVEAVSHSPQWKSTCIFVIEDDAQAGPDHVDGHRTSYMVISPYNKRHTVDSNFYTTTNMLRSIELMLGLDPMNKFDAMSKPIDTCFSDEPDLSPYRAVPNRVPLGLKMQAASAQSPETKTWVARTKSLDWTHLDGPDSYWLDRIIWYSLKGNEPYPGRAGDHPGQDTD